MSAASNRLPILAAEIKTAHQAAFTAAQTAAERARDTGTRLIEAKALLQHGAWLPWLRETGVAPRTAQDYMRLARLPADNYATVAHLGIRMALAEVAKEQPSALDEAEAAVDELEMLMDKRDAMESEDALLLRHIWQAAGRVARAAFENMIRAERMLGLCLEERWDGVDIDADLRHAQLFDLISSRLSEIRARFSKDKLARSEP
jgi:hypothetical protein